MDILLGGGKKKEAKGETKQYQPEEKAPLELMSQFLILIADRNMKEALVICNELLSYEPRNKMLLEYRSSIQTYIAQGLDEVEPEPEEPEEEEEESKSSPENSDEDS